MKRENKKRIVHQTLCVIHDETKILLGMKKTGLGKGFYNSVGGHVEEGEAVHEAAIRETFEEFGIKIHEIEKMGLIKIEGEIDELLHLHIFKALEYSGVPIESDEIRPEWFNHEEIPYKEMWPSDKHWLPILIGGDKFVGTAVYQDGALIEQEVRVCNNLNLG